MASPQYIFGIFVVNIKALVTSRKCLFLRSAMPFCCGISTQELWWIIPWLIRKSPRIELKYSLPLSVLKIWIFVWNCVWIMEWKFMNIEWTLDFSFSKYTQHKRVWSSINVTNHFVWVRLGIHEGPHKSLWIIVNGFEEGKLEWSLIPNIL